jgi:hypothetical protein
MKEFVDVIGVPELNGQGQIVNRLRDGGQIYEDASGFLSYNLTSVGAQCFPDQDCAVNVPFDADAGDVALWHTHIYDQNIVQFLGDRSVNTIFPNTFPIYVTTPIGTGSGTFQIGPWIGGLLLPLPANIEDIDFPNAAPICNVSGSSLPGISPC